MEKLRQEAKSRLNKKNGNISCDGRNVTKCWDGYHCVHMSKFCPPSFVTNDLEYALDFLYPEI